MNISDRDAALAFLMQRINYERTSSIPYRSRNFKLDRMRELLGRLGNPQHRLRVVHIGGTKGKGSTAHMIADMLQAARLSVGLYTSPHLEHLEERFLIDGVPCSEQDLVETVREVAAVVEAMDGGDESAEAPVRPTYFEVTTAIAMLLFERRGVDFVVCEVGLGGRLDSTNVCEPVITVITSISLDHTRQLGDTVEAIACEKAGIIKSGIPLICGVRDPSARSAILATADRVGAPRLVVDVDFSYRYHAHAVDAEFPTTFDFRERAFTLDGVQMRLVGEHQALNGAVAIATLRELRRLGYQIPIDAIIRGMAATTCPARVEVIQRNPLTIVDAAHNVASVKALVDSLGPLLASRTSTLLFATSKDKDLDGMLRVLAHRFDSVICTRFINNPRAVAPQDIADATRRVGAELDAIDNSRPRIIVATDPREAWEQARQSGAELICVTGSFFIAAEMRRLAYATDAPAPEKAAPTPYPAGEPIDRSS